MSPDYSKRPSLAPRHWSGWLAVSFLWMLGWMPRRLGLLLISPLGPIAYRFGKRRRAIAERNLERCFPEWSAEKREEVLRASFESTARMIVEMSWCWSGPGSRFDHMGKVHGIEHLQEAEEQGNGVLMVTGHTTCLEVGGRILSNEARYSAVYRPLSGAVMEWYQTRGRLNYSEEMISNF